MNNDLISRKALKKKFDDYIKANPNISGVFELGKFIIDNAPTEEYTFEEAFQKTVCEQRLYCPERPQGKWHALTYHTCYCTNCHFDFDIMKCDFMTKMNFCPNCGADMRGKKND